MNSPVDTLKFQIRLMERQVPEIEALKGAFDGEAEESRQRADVLRENIQAHREAVAMLERVRCACSG